MEPSTSNTVPSKKSLSARHSPTSKRRVGGSSTQKLSILKQLNVYRNDCESCECLLCEEKFLLPADIDNFLSHLLSSHHLVIADTHCIADIKGYIDYWRFRLTTTNLRDICSVLFAPVKELGANPHIEGEQKEFFLLSDVLPEDRLLRQGLQQKRLEWVLQQQQFEREDTNFKRGCLICRTELTGTRAKYLEHLNSGHNLQLGRAANLVFIDELIDEIEQYLNKFQCIYCEKIFHDRLVLREHMRKKMHKRINPGNHHFDQYYSINYLEMGKNWQQVAEEKEEPDQGGHTSGSEAADGDVADWNDWNELTNMNMTCLFCETRCNTWDSVMDHLKEVHKFDFLTLASPLNFYQKVKLVNYIRNQVEKNVCAVCEEKFLSNVDLLEHLVKASHNELPTKELWDRAEYYFPTKENDEFLCQLDDCHLDDEEVPDCVTGEEPNLQIKEGLEQGRLSEVIELHAEINQSQLVHSSFTEPEVRQSTNTSKSCQHVKFKENE